MSLDLCIGRRGRRGATWLFCILLTWLLLAPPGEATIATAGRAAVVGEVYRAGSQELLYRELYYRDEARNLMEVVYRLPDDALLARKTLQFGHPPWQPAFRQDHEQLDRSLALMVDTLADNRLRLEFRREGDTRTTTLTPDPGIPLVIDAGFDPFVRHHWDVLRGGRSLPIQFPLVSRGRLLDMLVQRTRCRQQPDERLCLRIRLRSALLNLLVPEPVLLTYERDSRRLLEYRGAGNVALASGEVPRIHVRYRYPGSAGLASPRNSR